MTLNSNETEEVAELAQRARTQSRHAAQNVGRAARAVAEPVLESTAEDITDTAEKFEGTAEDAVRAAGALSHRAQDAGWAFLALSVSLYAGAEAYNKFRGVFSGRE